MAYFDYNTVSADTIKSNLNRFDFKYHADSDKHELLEDISITLSNGDYITIPSGFMTDGRSTPKFLRGALPQFDSYILCYLIHDYLYVIDYLWNELGTRGAQRFADKEMFRWQNKFEMNAIKSNSCYYAVRIFGRRVFVR